MWQRTTDAMHSAQACQGSICRCALYRFDGGWFFIWLGNGRFFHRPDAGYTRQQVKAAHDGKSESEALFVGYGADQDSKAELKTGSGEIKRVLHPAHKAPGHKFHDGAGDGNSAQSAATAHDGIDQHSDTEGGGDRTQASNMKAGVLMGADPGQRNK